VIYYTPKLPSITSSLTYKGPVLHTGSDKYLLLNDDLIELPASYVGCETNVWIEVEKKAFQVILRGLSREFSHAAQGNIYLADETGNKLLVAPEIVYLMRRSSPRTRDNNLILGYIRNYKDTRGFSIFLADVVKNKFNYREDIRLQDSILLSDGIYGYHYATKTLKKLDHNLNDVWSFDPGATRINPMQAIPYKETILYYPGNTSGGIVDKKPIPDYEHINYTHVVRENGTLYSLDRDTGDIVWQRLFAIALNDVVLHEDKLYAVGEYDCYRLSADTGEIEYQQQMAYNAGGKLYDLLTVIDNKLWVIIEHAFFQTHCLLILNLDTLALEYKIEIPTPYAPDKFLHYDEEKRQVYYRFKHRYDAVYQAHLSPLLVIDLDDLDAATTFEDKPDMDIGFKPAADNKDLEELWVHIKDAPLHKALRFGIIETQNQTSLHAVVHNRRVYPRKTFNGRVHFRYSGSDKPIEEVEEQLKVIESSFNDWAQTMDVEAGTGSGEPVSIDVAYIE